MSTPLLQLQAPRGGELWAKLESANPTGSVKDRAAAAMLAAAEAREELWPGRCLIEASSGNTAIALAAQCRRRGLGLQVVIPENVTAERVELLQLFGAELVYSPAQQGSNGAVQRARELAQADPELLHLDQYSNPANPRAHQHGTAPEIAAHLGGPPQCFVAGLGTGGTLMGCARGFGSSTRMVAVEPYPGEGLGGLRSLEDGFVPPLLQLELLHSKRLVSNAEAAAGVRWLLGQGIFAGLSSGATAHVAQQEAAQGQQVVFVVCDDGWRYRESGLFAGNPDPGLSYW